MKFPTILPFRLWTPRGPKSRWRGEVITVLETPSIKVAGTTVKKKRRVENTVTDAGDLYYAERAVLLTTGTPIAPVPTNFTDANGVPDMVMELYKSVSAAPSKGADRSGLTAGVITAAASIGVMETGYPLVNDGDGDNSGAGADIVTYHCFYATSEANDVDTDDVIITNPIPGASEPLLMWAGGLALAKTAADTAKVFVNHTMSGV